MKEETIKKIGNTMGLMIGWTISGSIIAVIIALAIKLIRWLIF